MKSKSRIAGIILIALAVVGFLTVADDFRHVGELIGVGAILLAGILLLSLSLVYGKSDKSQ